MNKNNPRIKVPTVVDESSVKYGMLSRFLEFRSIIAFAEFAVLPITG